MDHEPLRPTRASRQAFDWMRQHGDSEVEPHLTAMASRVRAAVPACVAMSISVLEDDLTFTLMADRPGAGLLDAMQYLDDGPCLRAVRENRVVTTANLPIDEGQWQLFARAEAFAGIASTLSLPMMSHGRMVGGVNLYGSAPEAFDGHHEELAVICGAWAEGAVTNADLSFTSRLRAAAAPEHLRDRGAVDIASGYIAAHLQIALTEAEQRLRSAARQAGVLVPELARFILDAHEDGSGRLAEGQPQPSGDPEGSGRSAPSETRSRW